MSYTIQRGDTLSKIASANNTSVSALMKANPSIKNANVIDVGEKLNIPGSKDTFTPAKPKPTTAAKPAPKPTAAAAPSSSGGAAGSNPATIAQQYLGQNISALKQSGGLSADLDKWPANNVCCANFVSGVLQKAGEITKSQHSDSVSGLAANLSKDPNFQKVSLANAKPGDVVCFSVPGEGSYAHTEIYEGMKNGQPQFIGSNNVNADGTQRISQGHVGYTIDAIYQYKG